MNLQMENLELRIKVQKLELEVKELRKELESLYNNSIDLNVPKNDVISSFETVEKKLEAEETIAIENDYYRGLRTGRKRDREILIALSINNGLNRDEIIKLFFADHKSPIASCNTVLKRLHRDGHVRVDKNAHPYKYFSKHQFKTPSYEGYIYFIKEFHSNTYKIGKSKNIVERLRMFNVKLPFEWELIHSIKVDDYSLIEKLIHKEFSDKRISGTEWFNLDEEDIERIKNNDISEEIKTHLISDKTA